MNGKWITKDSRTELFKKVDAEEVTSNTTKLLSTIELYQLAQLQLDKEDLLIFPLPVPFLENGYLIVEGFQKYIDPDEDEQILNFSLHLSLTELGNLRIDFLKNSEGMFIRISSESQEKLNFIKQYQNNLLHNLKEKNILGLSFSKENIDPATDLLKRLLPDGESIVNTKV